MGLSKVTINVGSGGLGRRALNLDKISGLLFYNAVLPSGFGTSDRVKKVYSLEQAEALGIAEGSVNHDFEHYQIDEYFRQNPEGELWIGIFAVPGGAYDFAEITSMINIANGEIRQLGVCANALTYAATQCATIQALVDLLDAEGKPFSVLFMANIVATVDITTLADTRAQDSRKVTVVIGEDGGARGAALAVTMGTSVSAIGAALGATSAAKVSESIGNPANFNMSNGIELETPAYSNGQLVSALTFTAQGALKDKGYLVLRKYLPKISGTYFERCPTATLLTDDFAFMEYNRTVDKAVRLSDSVLTPELNSGLALNDDGTMTDDVVGYFEDLVGAQLSQMEADGEISAFQVLIDPDQDVLTSSTVVVTIKILPLGIAEFITVNIGLTTSI